MTRPIDMLEHEMRDRLAAKDAEIAQLKEQLAAEQKLGQMLFSSITELRRATSLPDCETCNDDRLACNCWESW